MKETLLNKSSIVQRIWNSDIFSEWLNLRIKELGDTPWGTAATNLRAAKHRFESFATPLGRMMRNIMAVMDTAEEIAKRRSGMPEARDVESWLASLSEEKLVQLAMVCDAADEGLLLTREMDAEAVDIGTLHGTVETFVAKIKVMFDEGQAIHLPGYTKLMVETLKQQRVMFLGKQAKTLGGAGRVTERVIASCLARMQCFTKLACEVVESEFPHYDIFSAFRVFDLGETEKREPVTHEDGNPQSERCIKRLAQVFKVKASELTAQLAAHKSIALRIKHSQGVGNREAWQKAVGKTQAHHMTSTNYPVTALVPVLMRYLAYTVSTSGVEQSFSTGLRVLEPSRMNMTEDAEEAIMRFATMAAGQWEPDALVLRARELWMECGCGQARCHAEERCDAGVKRNKAEEQGKSEHSWLQERRRATEALAKRNAPAGGAERDLGEVWTEKHQAELDKQRKKQRLHRVEAFRDGTLLRDEVSDELREAASKEIKGDRGRDALHKTEARRRAFKLRRGKPLELSAGMVVWAEPLAQEAEEMVADVVRARGLQLAPNRTSLDIDLYIVKDIAARGDTVSLCASLTGAVVSSTDALTGKGPYVKFKRGLRLRRLLWASEQFATKHPAVLNIIRSSCGAPGSQWTLANNKAEFLALMVSRPKVLAVALKRSGEQLDDVPGRAKRLTKEEFIQSLAEFDHSGSCAW